MKLPNPDSYELYLREVAGSPAAEPPRVPWQWRSFMWMMARFSWLFR